MFSFHSLLYGLFAAALISAAVAGKVSDPATPERPRGYVCYRASRPLVIDGKLDDAAWKQAPWSDYFVDIEGDKKPLPTFRTRFKALWDDHYLYIGAMLEEPHVWATLTQHDSVIFHDNDFEIFIDPNGDNHEYYEIEINAFGTEWDLLLVKPYRDGGPALNSWEIPGLKLKTHVYGRINDPSHTDRGWSVEVALPWSVLREYAHRPAPPHDGDQWRIDFSRVEWDIDIAEGQIHKIPGRPEHNWVWSPQGVIDMHRPETWGYFQFSTATTGRVPFVRDRAEPVRQFLMRIYYAQRQYHDQHKRWADSLDELGLRAPDIAGVTAPPSLKITSDGYEAKAEQTLDGHTMRWHVRQDSRLWSDGSER